MSELEAIPADGPATSVSRPLIDLKPAIRTKLSKGQAARRSRLVDAGLELIKTEEYDRIQVRDVADVAEVSLGTLYHYFSSKEHLFAEVLVRWSSDVRHELGRRPLQGPHLADQLYDAFNRSLGAFDKQPQVARLVNVLTMSTDQYAADVTARLLDATAEMYVRGALHELPPRRARAVIEVANAVFSIGLRDWSMGRATMKQVRERLRTAVDLLLRPES